MREVCEDEYKYCISGREGGRGGRGRKRRLVGWETERGEERERGREREREGGRERERKGENTERIHGSLYCGQSPRELLY